MFTFSSNLWYNKNPRATSKKDGCVSLYLQVYIGMRGISEIDRFRLKLRWPAEKIDLQASVLLPRFNNDLDVNDYNILIMAHRAGHNEIAKLYRLTDKHLDMKSFRRDLRLYSHRETLVAYMNQRRRELYMRREIKEQTYKNVGSTVYSLLEYDAGVRFDQINVKWMNGFKAWLINTDHKAGTVWTKLKDVKRYLSLANEEKFIFVDENAIAYPNPEPAVITIFLNRAELNRLIKLISAVYLTDTEYNVLKAFIFTCFTSLRISDIYDAGKAMLVEENMLTFVAKKGRHKTPKRVKIPLIPFVKSLIDESLHTFFTLPSQQEYNRTLKDLAKKADIKKNITSHVGRHTFGFLWMTTSGNIYQLKEILGHTKIETTERYAHLDDEYNYQQALLLQKGFEVTTRTRREIAQSQPTEKEPILIIDPSQLSLF